MALFVRAHALLAAQPELPVVVDQFNPFDRKARSFTATQPQRLGVADSRALGGIMRIQIARCFNVRPRPLAPGLWLLLVLLHAPTSWPLLHCVPTPVCALLTVRACADRSTDERPLSAQVLQISDPWLISEMLDRKNYPHALDKPTTFPYNFYQGFDQA